MPSLLFLICFVPVTIGIGWLLVNYFDDRELLYFLERIVVAFVLDCLVLYLCVFIIAPFRLDKITISSLLFFLSCISLFGLRHIPWMSSFNLIVLKLTKISDHKLGSTLWLTAFIIGTTSLLQGLAPPNDYDSLAYHLSFPRYDIELGYSSLNLKTGWPAAFFPAFGGHLSRVALLISDATAAQMVHGLFGLVGATVSGLLLRRLEYGTNTALLGAIMFLVIRMVIWQMGSAETDVPVAALVSLSLLLYLILRSNQSFGLDIIFGLVLGSSVLMKYHGFVAVAAMGPFILYDAITRRKALSSISVGAFISLLTLTPHLVQDFVLTGNPIFPLFNSLFNPSMPLVIGAEYANIYGTGRDLIDLIIAPWTIFVLPTHYFDGMVIGAPYLLVFFPLIFFNIRKVKVWLFPLGFVLIYFIIWFWFLSQQVRFLAPTFPILSAMSAAGLVTFWSVIKHSRLLKTLFSLPVLILALNQLLFVGVFALLRLPVSFGLITALEYHQKTPTMNGAYFVTCKYIEKNLKAGEKYFVLAPFVSFYCPQASSTLIYFAEEQGWWLKSENPPEMSKSQFLERLNREQFKYFLVQFKTKASKRISSKAFVAEVDLSLYRFGAYLNAAFKNASPIAEGPYSAIFDGKEILELLNKDALDNK